MLLQMRNIVLDRLALVVDVFIGGVALDLIL